MPYKYGISQTYRFRCIVRYRGDDVESFVNAQIEFMSTDKEIMKNCFFPYKFLSKPREVLGWYNNWYLFCVPYHTIGVSGQLYLSTSTDMYIYIYRLQCSGYTLSLIEIQGISFLMQSTISLSAWQIFLTAAIRRVWNRWLCFRLGRTNVWTMNTSPL